MGSLTLKHSPHLHVFSSSVSPWEKGCTGADFELRYQLFANSFFHQGALPRRTTTPNQEVSKLTCASSETLEALQVHIFKQLLVLRPRAVQQEEESAIHSHQHAWAQRCPRLALVPVSDGMFECTPPTQSARLILLSWTNGGIIRIQKQRFKRMGWTWLRYMRQIISD